ncbi:FecR domain-containing protein [Novosphingobium resinovorum]
MVTLAGDQARDEAARFVARMDADDWTEADESELQAWLAEDPLRQGLLLQVQAQWLALTPEVEAPAVPVEEEEEPAQSGWGRRGVLAGLAASAALAFVGLRWSQSPAAYTTKLGEIRRLPLPDGSVMTMNSGSELTVSMATKLREVQLAQGEAWFEVAKDAQRPSSSRPGTSACAPWERPSRCGGVKPGSRSSSPRASWKPGRTATRACA